MFQGNQIIGSVHHFDLDRSFDDDLKKAVQDAMEVISDDEEDMQAVHDLAKDTVLELADRAVDESPKDMVEDILEGLIDRSIHESPSEVCSAFLMEVVDAVIAQSPEAITERILDQLVTDVVKSKYATSFSLPL